MIKTTILEEQGRLYVVDERKLTTGRRAIEARIHGNEALAKWGVIEKAHGDYYTLQRLCGKEPHPSWRQDFDEHDLEVCEALAGPHGYTIYKALLVKKDASS